MIKEKKKKKINCKICNKEVEYYPSSRKAKYCSIECRDKDPEFDTKFKIGHVLPKATIKKMSLSLKGKTPWNKNLQGKEYIGHFKNKKVNMLGINNFKLQLKNNPILFEQTNKKISLSHKKNFLNGRIPYWTGKKQPIEMVKKRNIILKGEKFRSLMRESRAKQVFPIKDTKIEVKIQDYLNLLKISFNTHRQLNILHAYQTDIFISSMNLVIECDGDYWHANPLKFPNPNEWQKEQIKKDKIRTKELKEKEYNILRLWESEINKMNIEEFTNILFKNHD
jgi:very-short-patch-repair endonuclease